MKKHNYLTVHLSSLKNSHLNSGGKKMLDLILKLVAVFDQILNVITFQWWPLHSFYISLSSCRSLVCTQVWIWLAAQGLWVQGEVMPACSQVPTTPCSVFFKWCFTTWLVWLEGLTCMQITWADSAGKVCAKQTFWNEVCHSLVRTKRLVEMS